MLTICHNLHKGISKERLIKRHLIEQLSERLATTVYLLNKITQQSLLRVKNKALARDIVRLVVDYSAMGCRAARNLREQGRQTIVAAPSPELSVFNLCRTAAVWVKTLVNDSAYLIYLTHNQIIS